MAQKSFGFFWGKIVIPYQYHKNEFVIQCSRVIHDLKNTVEFYVFRIFF